MSGAGSGGGGRKGYVGRGFTGVLGVLRGGGSQYILAPTISVTAGTEDWSWR